MQFFTGKWPPRYATMYFVSLALLIGSLPLSKFTLSLFQFSTLFFWLWHDVKTDFLKKYPPGSLINPGNLLKFLAEVIKSVFIALLGKFRAFFRNKPAMAIASILLLHVIGLTYTSDFNYALKDLRTKLPLFILPLFIATGPRISTRTFYWLLGIFIAAVVGGSIFRLILFINLPTADSRALAAHTSHIRYSLNAVFAIFILLFFVYSKSTIAFGIKGLLFLIAMWLIVFLTFMNYTTGILIFAITGFILLVIVVYNIRRWSIKTGILMVMGIFILVPLVYFLSLAHTYMHTPEIDFTKLEKYTPRGNSYYHDTVNFRSKNGKWPGLYICDKELRQSWATRSTLPLDSLDKKKQLTRSTLITYLASRSLRKDSDGMSHLTDRDIRNIENGINRYDYYKLPGPRQQFEDFLAGYQNYVQNNDPNSGSMIQRFEYWRASLQIIRQNPVSGVGTGDVPNAFKEQYTKTNSRLSIQNRLRSHNQFLSITVAFGIIGLAWFLVVMFYPGIKTHNFNNYFYLIFWIIFILSMLTEDTIESQEGVTFYVLFTSLLLLGRDRTEQSESIFS